MYEVKNVTWDAGSPVATSNGWTKLQELSRLGWEVKSSHGYLLEGRSHVTVILQRPLPTTTTKTGNTAGSASVIVSGYPNVTREGVSTVYPGRAGG
jgi:hypothetical protein